MFFDFHTHHTDSKPGTAIVNLPTDLLDHPETFNPQPQAYYSAGIHPWDIVTRRNTTRLKHLEQLLAHPQIVAVGECGLDQLTAVSMQEQTALFVQQAALAGQYRKPLIIHCVKAWDQLLYLHRQHPATQPWIVHGFRGKAPQTTQLLRAGLSFSFGSKSHDEAIAICPLNRLHLETDEAPSTALPDLYTRVSNLKQLTVKELRVQQYRLFRQITKRSEPTP